ncbi:nonsense-mediated mrna decay protein [Diplodia corticola]|uniref:Nonsense-mediated mrna decay protein n=1 Tax=Diplodia corticola TaxID=236234 RepID=A0A1J9SDV4_9PEZI|nr:nonsense-mediated mrna decay protein [Diplodia corticola]OJD38615.1 nonsense-mediated mrna decay protein [Diplodia corticola]
MAPPSTAAAPGANGVLPVPAAALQKNTGPAQANGAPRSAANRSHQPRLKLVVRRLAPGLTQQEFELALGDDWKLGQGRVDWFTYKPGKISKDLAKPSKPSRAYFHLTDQAHVIPLADKVRKSAFNDAKNSTRDPALIGAPTLDVAPFSRTPGGRRRNDARQGLIDQDPEFKDFLESLTNPVSKPAPVDNAVEDTTAKKEDVKTTPLIEHLREKKAAKEKPQASKGQGKHARGESKEEKAASKSDKKSRKGGKEEKGSKQSKSEKAAKESTPKEVKILNKKSTEAEKTDENKTPAPNAPASERKRERGSTSIAKQMLQRDLGIGPAASSRRGRRDTAQEPAKAAETTTPKESAAASPASSSPATKDSTTATPSNAPKAGAESRSGKKDSRPTRAERRAQKAAKANAEATAADQAKPATAPMPPTGPKILKKPQNAQQQATPANDGSANAPPPRAPTGPAAQQNSPSASRPNSSRKANNNAAATPAAAASAPTAAATARQAFLKHANPSQGITEPLIEAALSAFGAIDKVEIDKRKGFAYVDFKEPDGLQKAIQASPVKIAEGAVQVLERKDKTPAQRAPRVPPAGPAAAGGPIMGGGGGGSGGSSSGGAGGRAGFRGGRGGRGHGSGGGGGGANASTANAAGNTATATTPAAAAPKAQAAAADTPS